MKQKFAHFSHRAVCDFADFAGNSVCAQQILKSPADLPNSLSADGGLATVERYVLPQHAIEFCVREPYEVIENAGKNIFRFCHSELCCEVASPSRVLERNRIECARLGEPLRRRSQIGDSDGTAHVKTGCGSALLRRVALQAGEMNCQKGILRRRLGLGTRSQKQQSAKNDQRSVAQTVEYHARQ